MVVCSFPLPNSQCHWHNMNHNGIWIMIRQTDYIQYVQIDIGGNGFSLPLASPCVSLQQSLERNVPEAVDWPSTRSPTSAGASRAPSDACAGPSRHFHGQKNNDLKMEVQNEKAWVGVTWVVMECRGRCMLVFWEQFRQQWEDCILWDCPQRTDKMRFTFINSRKEIIQVQGWEYEIIPSPPPPQT